MISTNAQARYLVATGKRDEAIALLVADRKAEAIRELDALDAVDELGEIATRTDRPFPVAKALGRRRRFDLLRPLLVTTPSTLLKNRFVAPGVTGAIAGLWRAPAVPDDSVLVRDWLVPATQSTGTAWHARSECGQLLALLGDIEMARAIADELRAAITGDEVERLERMAELAPLSHLLGEGSEAARMLSAAQSLYIDAFHDDSDDYSIPFQDTINHARAVVEHMDRLVADRTLPWRPEAIVSSRFLGWSNRYGPNRDSRQLWRNRVEYVLECGDVDAAFRILDEVREQDVDFASYILIEIANGLPRARIDAAIAARLSTTIEERARTSVIYALVESGHISLARTLVTGDIDVGPWRDELTARR